MCFTHQNPSYSERGDGLERGAGGGRENRSEGTGGNLNRGGGGVQVGPWGPWLRQGRRSSHLR